MNIVNLIKAVKEMENCFAELGVEPPTIALRSRADFGSLMFELLEQGELNKSKLKIMLKHLAICDDAQEIRIGEVTIRAPTEDEEPLRADPVMEEWLARSRCLNKTATSVPAPKSQPSLTLVNNLQDQPHKN